MIKRSMILAVVAVVLASLQPAVAGGRPEPSQHHGRHVPNRALVGATTGGRAQADASIRARGGRVVSYYEPGNFFIVETPSAAPDWVAQMQRAPGVRYAELDFELTVDVEPTGEPLYSQLWAMPKISMPAAWETTTGSDSIVVGVIDTGVDWSHEDLDTNMWTNPGETIIDGRDDGGDSNTFVDDIHGYDCVNNDGNPMDDHGHGTHVAGTIGAVGNNGVGVAGVNWDVQIMALKFLSASGSGSTTDAIECLDYATTNGAMLTNNSWGGGGYSQALYDAIGRANAAEQLFVAAAGNSSVNTDSRPHYPSSYAQPNIVSVAATDSTDKLASFSNYGASSVDLGAPGVSILSTTLNNTYGSKSGTSMASPHVAGAAALLLAAIDGVTMTNLKDRLMYSGAQLSSLSGKTVSGRRLDVAAALTWVEPPPPPTPPITLSAKAYKVKGQQRVDLSWTPVGASGSQVDIYRNDVKIRTTDHDGLDTDAINAKGGGTYRYKVCETGSLTNCSNEVTVVF